MRHDKDSAEWLLKGQVGNLESDGFRGNKGGLLLLFIHGGFHHHAELAKLGSALLLLFLRNVGVGDRGSKEEDENADGRKHVDGLKDLARL